MKKRLWLLALLTVCFMGFWAQDALSREYLDPEIQRRIEDQHDRIENGARSRQLSRDEARLLKDNLHHIQDEAMRLQADGRLSHRDKERLVDMLDQNDRMIQDKTRHPVKDVAPGRPAPGDPEIRDGIAEQQRRINLGTQSGDLTLQESKVLTDNLSHIREEEVRFRADGTLDSWEKRQLLRMLDQNAAMIRDKKDNPIVGYGLGLELEDRGNSIPQRVANQHFRINNGVRSGALSRREAAFLTDNLDFIVEEDRRMSRGGLSDRQKERLHLLLDQNGAMIRDNKNNPIRQFR